MDDISKIKEKKMKELMSKAQVVEVKTTDSDFEQKVIAQSSKVPVVVDFWASWCMPCQMLGPTLSKIAKDYGGRFVLAKANIDENQGMSQQYGVMSIPSVKLFVDGHVVDEFVGALPESSVKQWLDRNL